MSLFRVISSIKKVIVGGQTHPSAVESRSEATPPGGIELSEVDGDGTLTQAPTAWLNFRTGSMAGQSIPLRPGVTSIGRAENNDIVMEDTTISRRHARISYREGQYFIEDEGSVSGTLVEGAGATQTPLTPGATLKLGGTEMVFTQAEPTSDSRTMSDTGIRPQAPGETVVMEQPRGVMAWLAVTAGPQKGSTYQLKAGDNTIGRDTGNDLMIEDSSVSRRHTMIKVKDGEFLLVDLGSRGGTKVGENTLKGKVVRPGKVISVGQTRLSLVKVESGEPSPQPVSNAGETIIHQPDSSTGGILVAQSGPDAGKSFPLAQGDNLIGRDLDSAVLLTDETVSRRHALIRREDNRFVVFDLGRWVPW